MKFCPLCPTWKANRHQSTHNRWYCWIAKHVFQFVAAILVVPLLFSRSFTLLLASTVCITLRWRNEVPSSHYFKTLFPLRRICADFLPLLGTIFKIKVHQETEACSWDWNYIYFQLLCKVLVCFSSQRRITLVMNASMSDRLCFCDIRHEKLFVHQECD